VRAIAAPERVAAALAAVYARAEGPAAAVRGAR
jgi:hypothetical protein